MPETTVIGGSVDNIIVTVSGNQQFGEITDRFRDTIGKLLSFVDDQKTGQDTYAASNGYTESLARSQISTFGPTDIYASGSDMFGLQAEEKATIFSPGKGSSSYDLRNIVGSYPEQQRNVVDSSAGANNISILQGSVKTRNAVADTISAVANLTVKGGHDQHISAGKNLFFIDGAGTSYVSADQATIFGTSNSVYHFVGTGKSSGLGDSQEGAFNFFSGASDSDDAPVHDILFDASSSHGAFTAVVGNRDTIIGGSGSDTFYINDDTHASGDGGDVSATLTGGSGAANLFQFMDNEGGHYTITDFGSAAGNMVAFKGNQRDLQDILKNATVSGGNTTIRLKDNTEITFLNQDHLKSSDFNLFPS
ncbi:hypothetical protein GT348_08715 [Aristophania vespae]|uniref:Calcium-binding protein n=1 Tax=Aristophania vespae TaxID=2697033 RepID=A0A6P1NID7_9PROT|nr:hypothetical protein [Aristophania vespae]QHI94943.1 hypothetical protein GT348_00075 [Aristophania vespae]QHI96290.1 hypothetical protein GT348_08715 [Aristophania vespae]